jgi:ABC-type transporter Mla subunit MlaD
MNTRSEALGSAATDPNASTDQIADALDQSVAINDEAVAAIRALPQPPGDEARLAAMYAEVDALSAVTTQFAAAIRAQDQATARALGQQIDDQQAQTNAEFNDYGLVQCGS